MNTITQCDSPDIEAYVTMQLPVDLGGTPFLMSNQAMDSANSPDIEFYSCNNCGEQFTHWEDAEKHKAGGN